MAKFEDKRTRIHPTPCPFVRTTWGIALKPEALSVVAIHESQEVLWNLYSTTSLSNLPILLGFFGKAAILVALADVLWV